MIFYNLKEEHLTSLVCFRKIRQHIIEKSDFMGSLRVMRNENTEQRSRESLTHRTHINTDKAKDTVTEVEKQS